MTVGWVYDDFFLKHDVGPSHPERPERLRAIVEALEAAGLLDRMKPLKFGMAIAQDIGAVHDPAYVDLVRIACEQGLTFIGSNDTRICPQSYGVALLAAGGVMAACDAVMAGEVGRAFCAVRPPGHHAEPDQAMGFCLFNNVAVAAEHLARRHGLKRVAIVDFDVHHGNGTQHIFEERADVLYVSLHETPERTFPGTGFAVETGRGAGAGCTLNVPLWLGSDDATYRRMLREKVLPAVQAYEPQMLLISAGFDAACDDPMSRINLSTDAFGWITRELVSVADGCCGGRIVSTLEGGYNLTTLAQGVVEHVRALMDEA